MRVWCAPIGVNVCNLVASLVPRPRPPGEGKGLVTIARFLVCAESAVLFSRQPIRLLGLKISCDIKRS